MTLKFMLFLVIGRLITYLGGKFPPLAESRFEFVRRLWTCSECSGVWVYTFLSFVMGEVLFRDIFYVRVLSELVTGGMIAFFIHLIERGWHEKFTVVVIE